MKKRLPLSKGTVLQSRYRILRQLGHGGMGAVYEASDGRFKNRLVALKETYADSDETRRAFEREAQLLANTEHEAFPRVIDYFNEAEGYFLVMELIRGKDLADLLQEQVEPFEQEKVLAWADQILDALEDLHANRIIHRDIKPSNLKLTPKGRLKLLDFGIAKGSCESDATKFTTVGSLAAATFEYAPLEQVVKANIDWFSALSVNYPEQTAAILQRSTDAPSDLYALSATLYQLLTKHLPVNAPTRALAIWAGQADKMRPAHELNERLSPLVSAFLQKGLELDRKDRFTSALEMREALRKTVSNLPGRSLITENHLKKQKSAPQSARPVLAVENQQTLETVRSKSFSADDPAGELKKGEKSARQDADGKFGRGIFLPLKIQLKEKPQAAQPVAARLDGHLEGAGRSVDERTAGSAAAARKGERVRSSSTRNEATFEPKLLFQEGAFRKKSQIIFATLGVIGVITILGAVIGMATFQRTSADAASRPAIKDSAKSDSKAPFQTPIISTKQKSLPAQNTISEANPARKTNSSLVKTDGQEPRNEKTEAPPPQPPDRAAPQNPKPSSQPLKVKKRKTKPAQNSDCIFSGNC